MTGIRNTEWSSGAPRTAKGLCSNVCGDTAAATNNSTYTEVLHAPASAFVMFGMDTQISRPFRWGLRDTLFLDHATYVRT